MDCTLTDCYKTCFIIDLPRLPYKIESAQLTQFEEDLIYYLTAMGLDSVVVESIKKFDFSNTRDLAFVHSMYGGQSGSPLSILKTDTR